MSERMWNMRASQPGQPSRTKRLPPAWGAEPLSASLDDALSNELATFVHKQDQYRYLVEVDCCFLKLAENLSYPEVPFLPMLALRSHSAFRASCGLSMRGQVPESFVVLRSCLEYALYALHISENQDLIEAWARRHDDDSSIKKARKEFQHRKLMATLKDNDAKLHDKFNLLYERTVDYGGHPNERGVFGNMAMTPEGHDMGISQIYLHSDGLALDHVLKTTGQCGVLSLLVLRFVYPERYSLLGINDSMQHLYGCL